MDRAGEKYVIRKDEKYVGFWMPTKLHDKLLKRLKQRRKEGEPSTVKDFINSLVKNAVE